ncbi:MAG TPA: hypothetical protein PKH36_16135 [Flavobacteriales bacterium]|nr:hypothetical protein [Flavobacteriales bacterium]
MSLVFVMPDQGPLGLALPLLAMGAFALIGAWRLLRDAQAVPKAPDSDFIRQRMVREALYSGGSYVILLIVSVFLLQGQPQQLYWLAAAVLVLLLVGASSAWRLLVTLVEAGRSDLEES